MRIAQHLVDELVEIAQLDAPLETCGLISKREDELVKMYPCHNAAVSEVRYEIDGFDQHCILVELKERELELGAIYHSHTCAEPYPSLVDIENAFYPDVLYVIVGVRDPDWPEVRAFWIRDGQVIEEQLQR